MYTHRKLFKFDGQSEPGYKSLIIHTHIILILAPKFEFFNKSIFDQYLYIFFIVVHYNFTTH
jgi:hypothetical protein